jgi:hypothetical protein
VNNMPDFDISDSQEPEAGVTWVLPSGSQQKGTCGPFSTVQLCVLVSPVLVASPQWCGCVMHHPNVHVLGMRAAVYIHTQQKGRGEFKEETEAQGSRQGCCDYRQDGQGGSN